MVNNTQARVGVVFAIALFCAAIAFGQNSPPTLSVPSSITVDATSPAGAVVTFSVTATSDLNLTVAITCSQISGSTFPIGTTVVTCTAIDSAGNASTASFVVTVKGAPEETNDLITLVNSFDLKQGIENSLDAKLAAAESALAAAKANDTTTACNQLQAFINDAAAQSGNALTADQSNQLQAAAKQIMATLGCQ